MSKRNILLLITFVIELWLLIPVLQHNQTGQTEALVSPLPKETASPTKKPISNHILFVSNRTGNYDIYQMDLNTKQTTNLTNNPTDDMNPQVSPDGKFIVFYSNRHGSNDIYRMDLNNHDITRLTKNNEENFDPAYSPDGNTLVFKSTRDDGLGDIFVMKADGSEQINLTPTQNTTEEWDPTFSKDGKKIIFTVRKGTNHLTDELFSIDADGSNNTQLTDNNVADWYPSVNLNNGSIAYISKQKNNKNEDIFQFIENKKNTPLTNLPGNDADPSWNTLGQKIIFINDRDGDYDLYLMNADGSDIKKIENTPSDELSPIFLPES